MKKRHVALGFLASLMVISFLDRLAIAVAGPRIQDALHIPPERWGWVLGAFALAYGIFEMPSGALGDRVGQRAVLTRVVIWWSIFTAATGASFSAVQLMVTQFLFGAGEAGAFPNVTGAIGRWFPKAERGRAQGVVLASSRIGGALSPLLVVPLLRSIGWRGMFCVLAGAGLVWAVLWRRWFHDRPADQPGITAEELAEIGGLAVTPVHREPPWRALRRSRQVALLMAMYSCYVWAAWFYFSWFPTYMVRGAGFTESEMGVLTSLPFVLSFAGNIVGGILSDRLAPRYGLWIGRCVLASCALAVSSLLIVALAFSTDKTAIVIFASAGFGVLDMMLPAAWAVCLDLGRAHAGAISGAMNTAGLAGGFVCTVMFGYLVKASGGYRVPICLIGVMVMIAAGLFLLIDPRQAVWKDE